MKMLEKRSVFSCLKRAPRTAVYRKRFSKMLWTNFKPSCDCTKQWAINDKSCVSLNLFFFIPKLNPTMSNNLGHGQGRARGGGCERGGIIVTIMVVIIIIFLVKRRLSYCQKWDYAKESRQVKIHRIQKIYYWR